MIEKLLERLEAPDDVGQPEYRLLYEHIKDLATDDEDGDAIDVLLDSLMDIRAWAREIEGVINAMLEEVG